MLRRRASEKTIAEAVAPGNPDLGIMLPYTPLHHLLIDALDRPIVCTSGNVSEEPMATATAEAIERLGAIADLVLTHNRSIIRPVDDSVGRVTGEDVQWALEHLEVTPKMIANLGLTGLMPPMKLSCMDHEGGGRAKFMQWDGKQWNVVSDWIDSDQSIVRPMVEASAAKYAKEKGLTIRDCK